MDFLSLATRGRLGTNLYVRGWFFDWPVIPTTDESIIIGLQNTLLTTSYLKRIRLII